MNFIAATPGATACQRRLGGGALQRQQRAVGDLHDLAIVAQARPHVRYVIRLAGGVDHKEQVIAAIGDHQVVEDAARGIGEQRISLAALLQLQDRHRHQTLQRQRRVRHVARLRAQKHLAHVADIENPGMGPAMQMLFQHAHRILHRHVVAREGHHLRPKLDMQIVKTGPVQFRHGSAPSAFVARSTEAIRR